MKVTTKDLAKICGVSRTTVTRALHGTGRISEETRSMILEKARELGYQPDLAARSLVVGKSMMLGVTIVDLNNMYFPSIVDAIEKRAREEDYILTITLHEDSRELERKLIHTLVSHRADGLILNPVNKGEDFWRMMKNISIPYCILGLKEMEGCASVGVDEFRAGQAATEFILQKGYRDIVFVAPQLFNDLGLPNYGHYKRWLGVQDVTSKAACRCRLIKGLDFCEQVSDMLAKQDGERIAFLCSGAVYAADVMRNVAVRGFKPLVDYGIIAFDRVDIYRYNELTLTTVDNHTELQGYQACDLLIKMIKGTQTNTQIEIPFDIVRGQTL